MTRVTDIQHEPLDSGHGNVSITVNDDTHIDLTLTANGPGIARTEGMLATNRVTDPDVIGQHIEDISDQLPDDVERTARRILQVDAWIRENDIEYAGNFSVNTRGFNPLRAQELILVEEVTERRCDHSPIVFAFSESVDEEERREYIDEVVERNVRRAMGSFKSHHFDGSVEAVELIEVESLAEAEVIVHGAGTNDEWGSQSALTSY